MHCQQCGGITTERTVDGITRPVCVDCGAVTYLDPKLAVAVVILRDGQVLLGKRGAHTRSPGAWSFPAGFVERGERVEDAAMREVKDETGLDVTLGPLLGVWSRQGEPVVLTAYLATNVVGTPVAGDDLEAVRWVSLDKLPELAFPHDREILTKALSVLSRQPSADSQ